MPPRTRQAPQRRCIGCHTSTEKRGLVRIVRSAAGHIEIDQSGRLGGRGAYVCARTECWEAALQRGRVERALRTNLTQEDKERLQDYLRSLGAEHTE